MKKKFLVLDVETSGDFGWPLIYDIAWKIVDKHGNQYGETRSFVVEEIFCNPEIMTDAFYGRKIFTEYPYIFAKGQAILSSWDNIIETLRSDIEEHKVKVFCAYNASFDVRAIRLSDHYHSTRIKSKDELSKKLLAIYNSDEVLTKDKLMELHKDGVISSEQVSEYLILAYPEQPVKWPDILDIYRMACECIMYGKKFRETAFNNLWITENGNFQTNAQVCYRYLTGDNTFIEKHTALADVEIETEILLHCLKQKKKIPYNMLVPASIVSRLSQYNGKYIHERIGLTFTKHLNELFEDCFGIKWDELRSWSFTDERLGFFISENLEPGVYDAEKAEAKFFKIYGIEWKTLSSLPDNFKKIALLDSHGIEWYVPDKEMDVKLSRFQFKKMIEEKKELDNRVPKLESVKAPVFQLANRG